MSSFNIASIIIGYKITEINKIIYVVNAGGFTSITSLATSIVTKSTKADKLAIMLVSNNTM